jgi:hypothetical protein
LLNRFETGLPSIQQGHQFSCTISANDGNSIIYAIEEGRARLEASGSSDSVERDSQPSESWPNSIRIQ